MTALTSLFAACFGSTRPAPRRSVSLSVESLEERQALSGSPMALPRPVVGAAHAAPERMEADEGMPAGWYVEFRKPGKRWNIRGPFSTESEAFLAWKQLKRHKAQARAPIYLEPPQPMEVPVQVVAVPFEVTLRELKRRTIGLEASIPFSRQEDYWQNRRSAWIAEVYAAGSPEAVANRIVELETATKWSAMDESVWRARRPSWLQDMRAAATPTDVDILRQEFADNLL